MSEQKQNNWQKELRFLLPVMLAAFLIFANSLSGEFVYDDLRQIARNPLIQDISLAGRALSSDVWAFKGDGSIAASNYWRPTFVAWLILNYQLFGLNPFGWHLLNVLLHMGACALAFLLLRRWGADRFTALAVCLIFAVHPVHTESVAWISGSPDLLFSLFFLASLWFAGNHAAQKTRFDQILSLIFYALSLGAKEAAVLCFPIFWLVFRQTMSKEGVKKPALMDAFGFVFPYGILALSYFLLRWLSLGVLTQPVAGAPDLLIALASVPAAFVFYLRQILFPVTLGINYPLRPAVGFGFLEFILPLIISVAALALFVLLAKRSFLQKAGLLIFLLPLLPALNLTVFPAEQIVHDRYLYLPLLGFLLLTLPYLKELLKKPAGDKAGVIILTAAVVLGLLLAVKTFYYNRVWADNLSLWQHAVMIDKNSAFNWSQFGAELAAAGRHEKAVGAYNNSLDIKPNPLAYLGKARSNLALNRAEEAVFDLKTVTDLDNREINAYTLYQTYEALAIAYANQKKYIKAIQTLLEARKRLPIYRAALTEKLAVVYYQRGNRGLALKVLEETKNQAKTELLPESKKVWLRLGMLYAELGQKEKARNHLRTYLRLTNSLQDRHTTEDRRTALELLGRLDQ